ncbi:hypothetical protein [Bacteroides thetaiotaomicron]|jgi:hypothetical protein|uniref:hypothetical protein n=1 Tax=Bacteroides thetaiotaomicron TaxID=818 RepID=UPI0019271797|nr:hypothetical protein [Bacteroides thetaiotaomicron]MBL3929893.1 hypothetical protein [Bacteroides thetaiotaomicron]MBL3953962.1 hypothetical protein [Bacteroides thetaiotaomicron]
MTEEELKVKFDHIQGIFNRCINHAYQIITDSIVAKSEYLNREQADELEQQEYIRTTDELAQLYIRYSVLDDIQNFYSIPDFFWESGFYEALKPDEKRKYLLFSSLSFDYSRYEQDNSAYDEELPYFSVVVRVVVLERYSAYLRKKKEDRTQTETQPKQEQEEQKPTTNTEFPIKAVPPIAETENPFGSILNDKQIELIADCTNEVKMFNASVTVDDLKAILSCKPNAILRSNNNRYVAFLFSELSSRSLITANWQSVIANNKLFLSKDKSRDKYLNQGDLATATNYVKGISHEKGFATIYNYIKQLKRL